MLNQIPFIAQRISGKLFATEHCQRACQAALDMGCRIMTRHRAIQGGPAPSFCRELLLQISKEKMEKQKLLLHDQYFSWKGDVDQYDDVVFLGIRI